MNCCLLFIEALTEAICESVTDCWEQKCIVFSPLHHLYLSNTRCSQHSEHNQKLGIKLHRCSLTVCNQSQVSSFFLLSTCIESFVMWIRGSGGKKKKKSCEKGSASQRETQREKLTHGVRVRRSSGLKLRVVTYYLRLCSQVLKRVVILWV